MAAVTAGVKLPAIQTKSIYEGKFKDRNPELSTAGKLTASGDAAELCMKPPLSEKRPDSPDVIRRFRATVRPDAGKSRVFYGRANDPHLTWAAEMTHGVCTHPSLMAQDLVNPDPKTRFRQALVDKKEMLYASHLRGPLGRTSLQQSGFPVGLNPKLVTFGIQTEKDGSAGELINPDKGRELVNHEGEVGRDLYRKTHFDYLVGEQCDRNYTNPSFHKEFKFGIPTPHDNAGKHVRQTLKWLHDTQCEKQSPIVSKRVDDFRERTQPQLGKVHDPIKDTLKVSDDHTFGILVKPDEYGAGDLLHGRGGNYLRGKDRLRGIVAAMRQHLKKANYHNFSDLLAAFKHYDKDGSGKIDINELRSVCIQFNLQAEPELLEQVMDFCDADRDGQINYQEFSNFLNWKDKLPSGLQPTDREATPRQLSKQIDRAVGEHRTSSSMINAVVGGVSTRDYRKYGVPTIRSDLPAPRIRRIDDTKNYGDESDAYGLTNPSIYSIHGVFEKDFLLPRERMELFEIFSNIGVQMTLDSFDSIFKKAAERHPKGLVSVESFRNILDEVQASQIQAA